MPASKPWAMPASRARLPSPPTTIGVVLVGPVAPVDAVDPVGAVDVVVLEDDAVVPPQEASTHALTTIPTTAATAGGRRRMLLPLETSGQVSLLNPEPDSAIRYNI